MDNNKTTKNQNFDFAQMEDKIQEVQDVIERVVNSRDFRRMSKSIGRVINQGVRQYQRQTFTQETQWESEPYREKKEEPDKTGYPGSDFVKPVFTEKKEKYPNLYASLGGKETKNYFLMVLGGSMAGFMGVAFMAVLLIQALDDVMHIQKEGRARRQEAEAELVRMENDLKTKLLEIHR